MNTPPRRVSLAPDAPTPSEAMGEGGLLGDAFQGPSWDRWRAVLKAAFAEHMTAEEIAQFKEVAGGREPPVNRVKELWCICGRRAGKDSIASVVSTIAALGDARPYLRPGERATILCLASDRAQAKIIFRYIKAYFLENPKLSPLITREIAEVLELSNGVEIIVSTSSFRAVRGKAVVCCVLDEVNFWMDENSSNPSTEVYNALVPALATIPNSMLIGISSPYRRSGLLFNQYRQFYGKNDDEVLVIKGATRQFNPTIPQRIVDRAIADDPEAAASEWMGEFRSDLSDYISREIVDAVTVPGLTEIPPAHGVDYRAFCDPSGGSSDSFTLAIAHAERDGLAVLDCLKEQRAPFSPEETVADFAKTLHAYGITQVTGDRYAGSWPVEVWARYGIHYEQNAVPKSQLYLELLPMLTSGRVQLLDIPRLANQLFSLERRTARSGKDSVDHPPGAASHDDACNSVAGVIVTVTQDQRPALLNQANMRGGGMPIPWPANVQIIYATVIVGIDGSVAVTYFAKTVESALLLLDFDSGPMSGSSIADAVERLKYLRTQSRPRFPLMLWTAENLVIPIYEMGLTAQVIPAPFLRNLNAVALTAATYASRGCVKISDFATEKSKTHPLGGALSIRAGDDTSSPLRAALLLGINIGLASKY